MQHSQVRQRAPCQILPRKGEAGYYDAPLSTDYRDGFSTGGTFVPTRGPSSSRGGCGNLGESDHDVGNFRLSPPQTSKKRGGDVNQARTPDTSK